MKILNEPVYPQFFEEDLKDFYDMCVSHKYLVDVAVVELTSKVDGVKQKGQKMYLVEAPDDHDGITQVFFTMDGIYKYLRFADKREIPKYNN